MKSGGKKISKSKLGHKVSKETRRKISQNTKKGMERRKLKVLEGDK